jgi:hypothetical protein
MLRKRGSVGARTFHYEYNVMSRGFCQEKIFSNQDLVKRSNPPPIIDCGWCDGLWLGI